MYGGQWNVPRPLVSESGEWERGKTTMAKAWVVIGAALAIAVAPLGTAWCGIAAGQVEVAAAGTFIAGVAGNSQATYLVDASVHHLITDYFSGGVRLAVTGVGEDRRAVDAWITVDLYTMGSSTSVPYMGAGIGRSMWTWDGVGGTDTIVEGHLGFKTFIRESTAVSIEARYEAESDHFNNGILGVHAGFSVFF